MQISLSLLITISFLLLGCSMPTPNSNTPEQPSTEVSQGSEFLGQLLPIEATAMMGDEIIELEVTRTPQQQQLGLMYRDQPSLPDNRGMLFSFDEPKIARFWMKNVLISLDMVFLLDGKIQAIEANVPPCNTLACPTYGPEDLLVNQVIELRGGRAAELELQPGDTIEIEFLDSQ